jgi:hypothetical protein
VPSISKSNQYASSDLACYFSSSDLVMIYIRNLDWNLSNYSTATILIYFLLEFCWHIWMNFVGILWTNKTRN